MEIENRISQFILFAVFLIISMSAFSQSNNTLQSETERKNEIKLNVFLVLYENIEISYEHIDDKRNASIGITTLCGFEGSTFTIYGKPFYRMYFGEKTGKGFFLESNLAIGTHRRKNDSRFGLSAGFMIGGKFVRSRFVLEPLIGINKVLNPNQLLIDNYLTGGINIGFAF